VEDQQKTCTNCKLPKILSEFSNQKRGKYGKAATCRPCRKFMFAEWRHKTISEFDPTIVPEEKFCPLCDKTKSSSDFTPTRSSSDGLFSWCKDCKSKRTVEDREIFYQQIREIKESTPCADCGDKHPFYVMQFDHLPEYEKLCMISTGLSSGIGGRKAILEETKKCEVVCANCHMVRTYKRKHSELFL
jgi:hypothetical protein